MPEHPFNAFDLIAALRKSLTIGELGVELIDGNDRKRLRIQWRTRVGPDWNTDWTWAQEIPEHEWMAMGCDFVRFVDEIGQHARADFQRRYSELKLLAETSGT